MHMPDLSAFRERIAYYMWHHAASEWEQKALQQVHRAFKRITMLSAIRFLLHMIVVDPCSTEYEPKFVVLDAKASSEVHSSNSESREPCVRTFFEEGTGIPMGPLFWFLIGMFVRVSL
jgi:hypothetical protein